MLQTVLYFHICFQFSQQHMKASATAQHFCTLQQQGEPFTVLSKNMNPHHLYHLQPFFLDDPILWPTCQQGKRNNSISLWTSVNYLNNISCAIRWKFIVKCCVTCVNPLPAHSEGSSGLNEVIGDGAAVVSAGAPRQLGCTVCHLLHRHWVWRAGRAWLNHKNRYCEVFAHAEAQTTLQNVDVNVYTRTFCKENMTFSGI